MAPAQTIRIGIISILFFFLIPGFPAQAAGLATPTTAPQDNIIIQNIRNTIVNEILPRLQSALNRLKGELERRIVTIGGRRCARLLDPIPGISALIDDSTATSLLQQTIGTGMSASLSGAVLQEFGLPESLFVRGGAIYIDIERAAGLAESLADGARSALGIDAGGGGRSPARDPWAGSYDSPSAEPSPTPETASPGGSDYAPEGSYDEARAEERLARSFRERSSASGGRESGSVRRSQPITTPRQAPRVVAPRAVKTKGLDPLLIALAALLGVMAISAVVMLVVVLRMRSPSAQVAAGKARPGQPLEIPVTPPLQQPAEDAGLRAIAGSAVTAWAPIVPPTGSRGSLEVVEGDDRRPLIPLYGEGTILISRAPRKSARHIQLNHPGVSSRQAELQMQGGHGWRLVNLSGTNPTRHNGRTLGVGEGGHLTDGDEIVIGPFQLRFSAR